MGPITFPQRLAELQRKRMPPYLSALNVAPCLTKWLTYCNKVAIVVTSAFACCMTALLMAYYTYENKRRDNFMSGVVHQENSEFLDLTDKENLEFRVSHLAPMDS